MNYKQLFYMLLLSIFIMLSGCQKTLKEQDKENSDTVNYEDNDYYSDYESAAYHEIDLDKEQGKVTISKAGTYELHGSLKGFISVEADKNEVVRLVLKQAVIQSEDGPAIRCDNAEKLILSLYKDTENLLSDTTNTKDAEADATVLVQNDLTINGLGQLSIDANIQNGVKAKDTLKLMEGTVKIQSTDNGIIGKDAIFIHSGSYQIESKGDAIKSTYDKDDEKGDIIIENGDFKLISGQDGIQAARKLSVCNGSFTIESGGGSSNGVKAANAFQPGGFGRWNVPQTSADDDTPSAKGLKSASDLIINDGVFSLNTSDDSVHANGDVTITGGKLTLASGDDGIHSDQTLTIQNGSINVTESYEGLEGADIIINGGDIQVSSNDDGINAAGGSDNDNETQPSSDHFQQDGDHIIEIRGGTILIDAKGDGLDSNGTVFMSGGSVVVFGPSDGGNGAIDYETSFTMNGGVLIAAGSSQMAQAPSSDSEQPAVMFNMNQQEANTLFYICDENGKPILGAIPSRSYSNVVISSPKLSLNKEYSLYSGGSGDSANDAGYIESGLQGGNLLTTVTLNDIITQDGQGATDFHNLPHGGQGKRDDFPPNAEHTPPQMPQ